MYWRTSTLAWYCMKYMLNYISHIKMNSPDALVEAGRIRLRPILMTALTTMVAMLPLALGLGEGTVMSAELAVVVIGGLSITFTAFSLNKPTLNFCSGDNMLIK